MKQSINENSQSMKQSINENSQSMKQSINENSLLMKTVSLLKKWEMSMAKYFCRYRNNFFKLNSNLSYS